MFLSPQGFLGQGEGRVGGVVSQAGPILGDMVWCLSCRRKSEIAVCRGCAHGMTPAGPRRLESGIEVTSAFVHEGAARRLVLRLKYRGCRDSAEALAALMVPLVPPGAKTLVPIPRIYSRRIRFGSDPALLLAQALARRCQLPVTRALTPRILGSANAGLARSARQVRFRARRWLPAGAVLVDDVITTGMTLQTAVATLGAAAVRAGVTATVSR